MRPAGAQQDPRPDKLKGESMDERDERQERRYDYLREGEPSTMAYVSSYSDRLVTEFMEWRERQYQLHETFGESIMDSLPRWETYRFGAPLFKSAHGILAFWVRCALAPEHGGRRLAHGYFDRAPRSAILPAGGVDVAAAKLARGMRMPPVRQSKRAADERIRVLDQQAAGLRLDVDGPRVPGEEG